ncbi:unnamed protein product [Rotaria socialis]|uniref:Uncharacterized protein n=2 Tax=Rotaria socialis TaxID=392032 RepID=A0A817UAL8_9BILA|nr:unnamed protein product [Rotaria socialis]CAF3713719.1 unnamed protein product [Rotaria socialis]CAF4370350.1 unnamed protein product [Rotaria socialis]CAF4575579.1 unnamed protein product [Rotaria socialis]
MEQRVKSLFKKLSTNQQQKLEHVHVGEASEFYFACRNGETEKVKQLLPNIPYHQLNQLEPNGSTALHAATFFGHLDIVHLLLHDYSCQRHLRNRHGFTAYEEAETDEMRQLFHRPSDANRFNDDSMNLEKTFQIVLVPLDTAETDGSDYGDHAEKPDQRCCLSYETHEEVQRYLDGLSGVKEFSQSRVGRYIMKQGMKLKLGKDTGYNEEEYAVITNEKFRQDALQNLLDEYVTPQHSSYRCCCELLQQYVEQGKIEDLLKLYTMETPFYHQLLISSSPLGFPFFLHLSELKQRFYEGYSYRGAGLTMSELETYRWVLKKKNSILSSLPFSSTSIVREVAEKFCEKSALSSDKQRVLFIYHFPQPCSTAINLSEIPEYKLPCISFFENEKEVLVSTRTYFKVTKIESDECKVQYVISLEALYEAQRTVFDSLKMFIKDDLKTKANKKTS